MAKVSKRNIGNIFKTFSRRLVVVLLNISDDGKRYDISRLTTIRRAWWAIRIIRSESMVKINRHHWADILSFAGTFCSLLSIDSVEYIFIVTVFIKYLISSHCTIRLQRNPHWIFVRFYCELMRYVFLRVFNGKMNKTRYKLKRTWSNWLFAPFHNCFAEIHGKRTKIVARLFCFLVLSIRVEAQWINHWIRKLMFILFVD